MNERTPRLLIVEDDKGLRRQLRWAFEGYDVTEAGDQQSALQAVGRETLPVVLLDLGLPPDAGVMGVTAGLALAANVGVTVLLFRYRRGDSNMRSVWLCSRNDAIGNVAVMAAAAGVAATATGWPDIAVAAIIASLCLSGAWQIVVQARSELAHVKATPPSADQHSMTG